jgi:hypothetical protein
MLYVFNEKNLDKCLPKILYYESKTFDMDTMVPEKYFGKAIPLQNHNKDTSRELKPHEMETKYGQETDRDDINKNVLKLNDNNDKTVNSDKTQVNDKTLNVNRENGGNGEPSDVVIKTTHEQKATTNNYMVNDDFSKPTKLGNCIMKPRETRVISVEDYEELDHDLAIELDQRSALKYLWDMLVLEHSFISLIFKRSIIDPAFLRVVKLVFALSMQFAINAMFFTDQMISNRIGNQSSVINSIIYRMISYIV